MTAASSYVRPVRCCEDCRQFTPLDSGLHCGGDAYLVAWVQDPPAWACRSPKFLDAGVKANVTSPSEPVLS